MQARSKAIELILPSQKGSNLFTSDIYTSQQLDRLVPNGSSRPGHHCGASGGCLPKKRNPQKIIGKSSSARKLGAFKISTSVSSSKGGKIKKAANPGSLRTSPFQDRSTAGNNWSREILFH
ncbi:hypothetical protein AVEN_41305-1 [Araneus ventricosus]|uniref:Uncharacterized protein n=1 Tax=Araneus ventricosus TaxID=182803 RepID=A0A4Y2WU71_ARAVE|nr:hypothetical protein AVEN_41305-1 [Araneus ventricosus]